MAYTVRLQFKILNSRRMLKTFIRPEFASNVSSHAYRYDTMDAADNAADETVAQMMASGRLAFIGADYFEVS